MRAAMLALVACHSGDVSSAGRVVVERAGETLIVRDTTHVIELPLTRSSTGHAFADVDLPFGKFPGRVALADDAHAEVVVVWITRLGDKRPENIQRWFDEKMTIVGEHETVTDDRGAMFGSHPARIANLAHHEPGHERIGRALFVDVPEHDLELLVLAGVLDATPTAAQRAWLDDVTDDVRALHVTP